MENRSFWKNVSATSIPGSTRVPRGELFSHIEHVGTVLDIGCGNGVIASYMVKNGFSVTGIDINEQAIAGCQLKLPHATFIIHDVTEQLPFQEKLFDIVISAFLLVNITSVAQREALINSIEKVLRPGGVVWIHEGLISPQYTERYQLCRPFTNEEHSFYSFSNKNMTKSINSTELLKKAINDGYTDRVIHHFTKQELMSCFKNFTLLEWREITTWEKRKGNPLHTVIAVFRKENQ